MGRTGPLVIAPLLSLSACDHVEGERSLSPEHEAVVAGLLESEPEATAMAAEMAERMDVGTVDATGASASGHELALSVQATGSWLQSEFSAGRIMEADPVRFSTEDTVAQYDQESPETHGDDRIVLDWTDVLNWNLATVLHEAAHRFFSHDAFVTQQIRDAGAELNEGFAMAVAEHGDYAYLITALYAIPSSLTVETDAEIAEARETVEEMAEAEGALAAQRWLASEVAMPSESEMLERVDVAYDQIAPCLSVFGLTSDGVRGAYLESGMHEALTERREAAVREFREEHRAELRVGEHGRIWQ